MDRANIGADLDGTLQEMGPNHMTDFADALVVEGIGRLKGGWPFDMWKDIGSFRDAMTQFLQGRHHAFIGGSAARTYKARAGPTLDYDILIDREEHSEIHRYLESQGGTLMESIEDTYRYRIASIGINVDIRVARSALDREALANAVGAAYQGRRLRIVRPEHLAAMKVKAYSERKEFPAGQQDGSDVRGLVRAGATSPEAVREVLGRHRADLLIELDRILSS